MRRRLVWGLLIMLSPLACSAPPLKERQQADDALAAARAAEAAKYDPDDLQAATAALKKYDDDVAQRDYRLALSDALEARDRAYLAAKQAPVMKAALRTQATDLIADVTSLNKAAAARLAGTAGPRLTGPALDRLRSATRAVPTALQEARSLVGKEDFSGAIKVLTPVADALRREVPAADQRTGRRQGR